VKVFKQIVGIFKVEIKKEMQYTKIIKQLLVVIAVIITQSCDSNKLKETSIDGFIGDWV